MYQSNKFYYMFFKYSFLIIASIILMVGLIGFFQPSLVSFNDSDITINQSRSMMLIATIPLIIFFLIKDRFVIATIYKDQIKIQNSNKKYKWNEVIVTQIPFVFPPLYKLKIQNKKGFKLFNTENKYLWVSVGIVKDLSPMGEVIRKNCIN